MLARGSLAGLRVMVVEDEMLVSLVIEDVLALAHCVIVGPFNNVPDAHAAAAADRIDVAVLDVNIAGVMVYPVAELLAQRGVPFVLLSGYGEGARPPDRPHWRIVGKPFRPDALLAVLAEQAHIPP